MNRRGAFYSGVVGALAMSLFAALARALGGVALNLEMALGSFFTWETDFPSWVAGLLLHLSLGGTIGMIYAWIFRHVGRAGARVGIALAVPHGVAAAWAFVAFRSVHPLLPPLDVTSALALVAAHLVYGGVVGARLWRNAWKSPDHRPGPIPIS